MMWPSLATHYNDINRIKNIQNERDFLEEMSIIRPEKLIAIKSGLGVGDGPAKNSNMTAERILACRVWIKKYELKIHS